MAKLDAAIRKHCAEINRCNQRGGRMLSIFDLLEARTLDLDLAAYLMARISRGDSFLVGARPGGAGKTTVMCALLNLIPPECEIAAATSEAVRAAAKEKDGAARCLVCHEIGAGPYFAYLWDANLRAYCSLSQKGHMLATNLHADDLEQARRQVCDENGVPPAHFNAIQLQVFLRLSGGWSNVQRRIDTVHASDGASPHSLVFDAKRGSLPSNSTGPSQGDLAWQDRCRRFLEQGLSAGVRTIEQARERFLEFLSDKSDMSDKSDTSDRSKEPDR